MVALRFHLSYGVQYLEGKRQVELEPLAGVEPGKGFSKM